MSFPLEEKEREDFDFFIGKGLKTKDLRKISGSGRGVCSNFRLRGLRGAVQHPNETARIAYAEGRVKPLARLLRCATALRVTAPPGCGSRRLVWPKGSLSASPQT